MSQNKLTLSNPIAFQGGPNELLSLLIQKAKVYLENGPFILTIDGRAASGKSTFSQKLFQALQEANFGQGALIHADEFFLRPEQRTQERLMKPGENVDYERLQDEVLIPFHHQQEIVYRPFNCSTFSFQDSISLGKVDWLILEGSYSLNEYLAPYASLSCFLTCDSSIQEERILKRSNPKKWHDFQTRWIPLEEKYIEVLHPDRRCTFYVDTSSWSDESIEKIEKT
ncbi:MAG: hypothetical protein K2H85_11555 [Allobaculum sp.]|nr:hypothetical protein [Allobaculum sp.]